MRADPGGAECHPETDRTSWSSAGDGSDSVDKLCSEARLHSAAGRRRIEARSTRTVHRPQRQGCTYSSHGGSVQGRS